MLDYRRIFAVACCIGLTCAIYTSASAAGKGTSASKLLMQAQTKFQSQNFVDAENLLGKLYAQKDQLSAQEQQVYIDLSSKVELAIDKQVFMEAMMKTAKRALDAGDFKTAATQYRKLNSSAFLKASDRRIVAKNLQLAVAKTSASKSAAAPAMAETKTAAGNEAMSLNKARAEAKVQEGTKAIDERDFVKAKKLFEEAVKLDPANRNAKAGLAKANSVLEPVSSSKTMIKAEEQMVAKRQAAIQKYNEYMTSADLALAGPQESLTEENFNLAREAVRRAGEEINNPKYRMTFSAVEFNKRMQRLNAYLREITRKEAAYNEAVTKAQLKIIRDKEIARDKLAAEARKRKIESLRQTVAKLTKSHEFVEALRVLREMESLDRSNLWIRDNIRSIEQCILISADRTARQQIRNETVKHQAAMEDAEIPWYKLIRYPQDWTELSQRRERFGAEAATDSEENNAVRKKLQTRLAKVSLDNTQFQDAIAYLRQNADVNIFVDWAALGNAIDGIKTKSIDLNFSNVTVETALRYALKSAGGVDTRIGYVIDRGIIQINTLEELNKITYARVYDVRDLLARIPNFRGPRVDLGSIQNSSDTTSSSSTSTGSTGSSGSSEGIFKDEDDEEAKGKEEEMLTKKEMLEKVRKMVTTNIDFDSWKENGGTGQVNEHGGNLIVTQTAENHRKISSLISKLREERTIQISIEARFITVNTGFLNQIGVDLDFYFNIGSTTGPTNTGAVYPNGETAPDGWAGKNTSFSNFSPIGAKTGSASFADLSSQQSFLGSKSIGALVNGSSALAIAGTFLDDIQVDFLIRATQAHSQTRMLTAPRITLMNGQRSYISIATQQAYIAGVEPIVSQNQVGNRPLVKYAPTGTLLDVDATVSHDRRYVIMTLRPQIVTLNLAEVADGTTPTTGTTDDDDDDTDNVGGIDYIDGVGLPNFTIQDLQTTVSVPDRGTLLIGGQRISEQFEREMGVPIISRIPILNRAFTNRGRSRDEQTLLILVKPQIIINDEEEEYKSNHVAKDLIFE